MELLLQFYKGMKVRTETEPGGRHSLKTVGTYVVQSLTYCTKLMS